MECIVAILFFGVLFAALYFFMRLRKLERTVQTELAQAQARLDALQARLGIGDLLRVGEADRRVPVGDAAPPDAEAAASGAAIPVATVRPGSSPAEPELPEPVPVGPVPELVPALPAMFDLSTPEPAGAVAGGGSVPGAFMPAAGTATPPPAQAAPPRQWDAALRDNPITRWFLDSHLVVRAGIVILFIGVAFLLRFVAEQGWFSLEMRLVAAGLLGVGMVAAGWAVRTRRPVYALSLQGGGLGIAYMTTFAAFGLYELIPGPLAFGILVALGVACGALAVINDSRALAVLAITGGFAAPVLASTGDGSHVALFAYMTVLNVAILGIAWFKSWRALNLIGFVFTLVLASLWAADSYQPQFYASVQPFLILFFLFYVAIGLLFARRQPPSLVGLVDGPLVFGTPVATFIWQAQLVSDFERGLAWSALGLGIFYFALGALLFRTAGVNYAALRESYLAIGSFFIMLAVPFAFEPATTVMVWAMAGAGLVWVGLRQGRRFHTLLGGLVQLGAGMINFANRVDGIFIDGPAGLNSAPLLLNSFAMGSVLLAVAGLITGYLALRYARLGAQLLFRHDLYVVKVGATLWGLLWWYGIGLHEIFRFAPLEYASLGPVALFLVVTAALGVWVADRCNWWTLRTTGLFLWLPIVILAGVEIIGERPLLTGWGWLAWPGALAVHYYMLARLDAQGQPSGRFAFLRRLYHAGGLWLFVWLGTAELLSWVAGWYPPADVWYALAWAALPVLALWLVTAATPAIKWPLAANADVYLKFALAPLILALVLWAIVLNWLHDGDVRPLAWLPLLNPLALMQVLIFGGLFLWLYRLGELGLARPLTIVGRVVGLSLIVYAVSGELARLAHQSWGVAFEFGALRDAELLQAAYSLVWTVFAMVFMFWGARRRLRWLWLVGAALLGLTILKLFLVDLSGAETLARIVSFIGVGLFMLLIGYFAPIPPVERPAIPAGEPVAEPAGEATAFAGADSLAQSVPADSIVEAGNNPETNPVSGG